MRFQVAKESNGKKEQVCTLCSFPRDHSIRIIRQFCHFLQESFNILSNLDAWVIHKNKECNPLASPRSKLDASNLNQAKKECDERKNCAMFFYEINEDTYFHNDFDTVNIFHFCDESGAPISTDKMSFLYTKGTRC